MYSPLRKQISRGFSLIELMIVVAIIGILAAIAVPSYNDYIIRSRVTELVNAAGLVKNAYSEFAMTNNTFIPPGAGSATARFTSIGATIPAGTNIGTNTDLNGTATTGIIKICGNATGLGVAVADIPGIVLRGILANNVVTWDCLSTGSGNFMKYVPANCRSSYVTAVASVAIGC